MYVSGAIVLCLFQLSSSEIPLNVKCGHDNSDSWNPRAPWLSSIKVFNNDVVYTNCAGALIDHRHIVTTASCFTLANGTQIKAVQIGTSYLLSVNASELSALENKTYYPINETIIHPLYDPKTDQHNIALIRLNSNTEALQPICMSFDKVPMGPFYTATWGRIIFGTAHKQYIPTLVTHNGHDEMTAVEIIHKKTEPEYWEGMLKGSPLMYSKNDQFFLQGLLKTKVDNVRIFTNIYPYLEWIRHHTF